MIDFIEYVVAELKSRRLSKHDAVSLVRQFSTRSSAAAGPVLHPLLHRNTSDLGEQRYRSTFDGSEFFLADHQVRAEGHAPHKILPGVAYLEMARAAVVDALPEWPESAVLELRNTAWAYPIVVDGTKDVFLALIPGDGEELEFEVFSEEQEIIHCQGRAVVKTQSAPSPLDVESLQAQTAARALDPAMLYAACTRMGLIYGSAFQAITSIQCGNEQVLAHLRMPGGTSGDFVLHPSLLDGALQSAFGLIEDLDAVSNEPRLPFALDSLRILAPCTERMLAWVRYAGGSRPSDKVVKLDIDLCDEQGKVCVQLHGVSSRVLRRHVGQAPPPVQTVPTTVTGEAPRTGEAPVLHEFLRRELSTVLGIPAQRIDPKAPLENYGIDSMLAMKLTAQLEQTFGSLPKTLFFEYQTVQQLAEYFVENHATHLPQPSNPATQQPVIKDEPRKRTKRRARKTIDDPIAIIGLSGRYPEAIDVDAYWQNLREGKDCITEVPKERWDWREYYSEDRSKGGKHYSKWGGFIAGVDEFDPLFFNISPYEAEQLDPQERLFLQHAWMAIEDAGYTRASLQVPDGDDLPGQVGVYAGMMYIEYQLFGAEQRVGVPGSPASIANRVSYILNLHGPSMTLDTMCSSSLSAIHLACQDLKQGRVSMAIAGGVNVTIHPNKYLVLSGGQFISSDGACQSFGEGGDGYIPGEGVGVVILKKLSEAKRDGDHIYGIIRGSALNHGGKTNGYTVPNPQAQASVITRALKDAKTDARHISYIEAHGTGTKLGDPIEIAALNKSFGRHTKETQYCRIGSAKSNIGHCEAAAGIAGLTKVLLQMQHGQIVPSLHSAQLNPHIDFAKSPFIVNQTLTPWEQPVVDGRTLPRIAGISSFGAGGSNAHMVIEEYPQPARQPAAQGEVVIVLSAKSPEQLRQKASDLLEFVRTHEANLADVAYTLQIGREAMNERAAFVVDSNERLIESLEAYLAGTVVHHDHELAAAWMKGEEVDWTQLYAGTRPQRVSLPTYPFAKERYWIDVKPIAAKTAVLHPLVHSNTSDLTEQRYESTFTGAEFFLADHQVQSRKVLPGVAYLEMARAAVERALPEPAALELQNVVFAEPIVVSGETRVGIALDPRDDRQIDFQIFSGDVIHCEGRAVLTEMQPATLDLPQLGTEVDVARLYERCAQLGLAYGPAFRGITALHRGKGEVVARIALPAAADANGFVLHPSVMDSALQACFGLVDESSDELRLPFALESLRIVAPCTAQMTAWVREASGKVDIDLCDERGNVCVQLRGLSSRIVKKASAVLLATPVWEAKAIEPANRTFAEQHVIVIGDESYEDAAVACFEKVQAVIRNGSVLVQIAVRKPLFAGLSGLLKTASLEHPQFTGQLVVIPPDANADEILANERTGALEPLVKYENGTRYVQRWQEVEAQEAPLAFREGGVYLITGGRGALGSIFANEIREHGGQAITVGRADVDLENLADVERFIASVGRIDGILHCAGMISDSFILKKSAEEFRRVLGPKVAGTLHLDEATKHLDLDLFVLFSSLSGALGNLGQADYATANAFMDHFAAVRNARGGRTRSINWPLWRDGGMTIDAASEELLQKATGMRAMQTANGVQAFHRILASPYHQVLTAEGDPAQMRRALFGGEHVGQAPSPVRTGEAPVPHVQLQDYLRAQFAGILKMAPHKIDPNVVLEDYGIDSIMAMKLTNQLEQTFGSLSKTLFFEYQTIAALAGYLVKAFPDVVRRTLGVEQQQVTVEQAPVKRTRNRAFAAKSARKEVAIVGLAGRYPQADNLREFWRNLREGRDSITEIPSDRWDHSAYFDPDPDKAGKAYSKWGGFISGVDRFDPLFFKISPKEAALIDPQERLFLETAWQTIEDAGYTKESIAGRRIGVYVGVMWSQYELFGAQSLLTGDIAIPTSSHASIANRVSYFFDLHGPSLALDTMCSSSLTAIHLACEEIRRGEIDAAIAGGVNVTIHPYKYLSLSQGKFAASDGRCRSFGEGGDGYVPGEGVGAVLLKPLEDAVRDGDQIYAVIKSSSVNHGGKTNGYTVPNPNAQGDLIADALKKANIDPRTLSYIETHGTGTSLGDPIEITGLSKAFAIDEKQVVPIGSVKSNIGHLESAAGIAAVTKSLLQLKHDELVPSLHAETLNPHIDFAASPFYVQRELAPWTRRDGRPRRIGVSSFGAGGSNAHLILEEFIPLPPQRERVAEGRVRDDVFVLSAKNPDALRRYAADVLAFVDGSFADVAYTSQIGRTAMQSRLAILASSTDELRSRLDAWLRGDEAEFVFHGDGKDAGAGQLIEGAAGKAFLAGLLTSRELEKLAKLWALGVDVDWSLLSRAGKPKKVSLPTYPFARERHWIKQPVEQRQQARSLSYTPKWIAKPLTTKVAGLGPILVLGDDLLHALREQMPEATFVREVSARPAAIVHSSDVLELFDACRALLADVPQLKIISLATAAGGFLRSLTLENPRFLGKAIEVGEGVQAAAIIRDELLDANWSTQEIRYQPERHVRELVELTSNSSAPLPIRRNGVYLITGGIGGLGLIFAEYLARSFAAKLVLVGRSAPNAEKQEVLRKLGTEVLTLQADVANADDVERIVREAKARFGAIHGVIHSAGVNRDAFLLKKTREQIESVLAPKVQGAINLDHATRDEQLDFFVLFSSVAGVMGNAGQTDYAYANRFLDAFAERRAQQRPGRTISIDWPLWEEGGMTMSPDDVARLEAQTGVRPLPTAEGIRYFEDFLRSNATQAIALYRSAAVPAAVDERPARRPIQAETEQYVINLIAEETGLPADRIDVNDPLESFGLDSIMINRINTRLERDFGELPKTLLYEHETAAAVAKFLASCSTDTPVCAPVPVEEEAEQAQTGVSVLQEHEPIAIIGMHGYYPQSADLAEYWENLRQGRELVGVVPQERWDAEELYDPNPSAVSDGKIYCKWGGFLADYDKFDPHFFKIPTAEAKIIDPQERLFLESVWAAIEDAGYTRDSLRARFPKGGSADVGVFAGVTTNTYHLWAVEERSRGNFVTASAMPWSIANRVSYFFDFNGPSMPVDTACSSSLVAIHLACEALRRSECQVAIAGGVNLYLHPAKYHSLCQRRALSLDGKCHSYGAGDDGFVPGEGVGTLVLKPLRKAMADGDHIHAVIRASAYDHSGRSNGYSAPNPNAQASLISRTLETAGIHPETIDYIEGHGTGTQLGDSLEIAALTQAFRKQTAKTQFCPIGSVKANVGHSESAAGIAGIEKVVLQMQHRQLAPSIHSDAPNPNIEFEQSPFYLQHGLTEWEASSDHPRRALINSFGAGGVNACVVVEEFETPVDERREVGPYLFALSAKNEDRLRDYADRVLAHLRKDPHADVAALCYTLQAGREAMEERLAIVVRDANELIARLDDWKRNAGANVHRGSLGPRRGAKRSTKLAKRELTLNELAARWVAGEDLDWESIYIHKVPPRISAPVYPFARERYWVADDARAAEKPALAAAQLHPFIAYNASTLKEVRFSSMLSDSAFFAIDHKVRTEAIFPGAGFLEMACIAGNIAGEQRVRKITDVVWMQPLNFRGGAQSVRTVLKPSASGAEYEISSFDDDAETVVHSEGRLVFGNAAIVDERMSLDALKAQARREESATFYDKFDEYGLHYGPSFRPVQEIWLGGSFALTRLALAKHLQREFAQYILHPSIIDGALQTTAGLAASVEPRTPYLPFALDEIELVRPLAQTCYAYAERAETSASNRGGVTKFNIRLLNERGDVLVRIRNLYVRPLALPASTSHDVAAVSGKGRLVSLSGESLH